MQVTTIPMLPCVSLRDTAEFYKALGFAVSTKRRGSYAVVRRDGLQLHLFAPRRSNPAISGRCLVLLSDVEKLREELEAALHRWSARTPRHGMPRISEVRTTTAGVRQFVLVDPSGNHLRFSERSSPSTAADRPPAGRLERALGLASALWVARGEPSTAADVLDLALESDPTTGPLRRRALLMRAEMATTLGREEALPPSGT